MITESPGLQNILQSLADLSGELCNSHDYVKRMALLRQMRMLLADADKILASEMGKD
jgi:hypothetical protein